MDLEANGQRCRYDGRAAIAFDREYTAITHAERLTLSFRNTAAYHLGMLRARNSVVPALKHALHLGLCIIITCCCRAHFELARTGFFII